MMGQGLDCPTNLQYDSLSASNPVANLGKCSVEPRLTSGETGRTNKLGPLSAPPTDPNHKGQLTSGPLVVHASWNVPHSVHSILPPTPHHNPPPPIPTRWGCFLYATLFPSFHNGGTYEKERRGFAEELSVNV